MLLLAVPPPVFADELSGELPKSTRDILDEGGTDLSDAARWRFSDLCDTFGAWAAEGLQPALHLAAQSAGYLLLAGLLGLLAGDPYRAYVEILAVLGFGTLSLSAAMQLTELVAATAQDCRTYLTAFVPVFSGLAAAGILAGATGQRQCAQLCRLYFEGARLCGSMLVLYFFMIFLSTALLLLAGNGGLG